MSERPDPEQLAEYQQDEFDFVQQSLAAASPDGLVHCRGCDCSVNRPCLDGCYWVEPDLCSECAVLEPDKPVGMRGPPFRQRVRPRRVA